MRTSHGEAKIAHEYLISYLEIKDACNKKKKKKSQIVFLFIIIFKNKINNFSTVV